MAFTYLIVNVVFLVCIVVLFMQHLAKPSKSWWITLLVLLILTAVFDSILVGMSIVGYNPDRILGIYIGNAPIEDFFYAVMAVIIVPALWNLFDTKKERTTR
jgi:lycopene cyclase domain-containing protein